MTAYSVLEQAILRIPEKEFIFDTNNNEWFGRAQIHKDIDEWRSFFARSKKDIVFLVFGNDARFAAIYFALLLEKWPFVLIDPKLADTIATQVASYLPKYIFSTVTCPDFNEYSALNLPVAVNAWQRNHDDVFDVAATNVALMLTTSGSTGSPKYVQLTLDNVLANAQSIVESLRITEQDRAITCLPIHYSYGLSVFNSHFLAGGTLVIDNSSVIERSFWNTFKTNKCTSFAGVPYTYQILHRLGFEKMELPTLKKMTQAGGRLSVDLVEAFARLAERKNFEFFVMYGQTEATARMSCLDSKLVLKKLGSVGRAIPRGEFKILDPAGERAEGEVLYCGPNVMRGYAEKRADILGSDINRGELHTGDLGYLDHEGYLYITGRSKRIAKVVGLRLSLDEIEAMWTGTRPVAVIAKDEKIVVFHSTSSTDDANRLVGELSRKLKLHPSYVAHKYMESFPLNSNGKMDYRSLESL